MLVLAAVFFQKGPSVAWLSFLTGLGLDLFLGQPLGGASLVFLVTAGVFYVARDEIAALGLGGIFGVSFLADLFFNLFLFRFFSFWKSLIFGLIFAFLYGAVFKKEIKRGPTLKLRLK